MVPLPRSPGAKPWAWPWVASWLQSTPNAALQTTSGVTKRGTPYAGNPNEDTTTWGLGFWTEQPTIYQLLDLEGASDQLFTNYPDISDLAAEIDQLFTNYSERVFPRPTFDQLFTNYLPTIWSEIVGK